MTATLIDPGLPWLGTALDPDAASPPILTALRQRIDLGPNARVAAAGLARHKPGRRALIQYTVADGRGSRITVLGKTHRRGVDHRTVRLHDQLSSVDLAPGRVPKVLGVVGSLGLWLQERVFGLPGFEAMAMADGHLTARRIGAALARFHDQAPLGDRQHHLGDEVDARALRLSAVAARLPLLADRIAAVTSTAALSADRTGGPVRGLHRDFYPDQVLVNGEEIHLLDLDLHAAGDPALDLGNFLAHLTEYDLRHGQRGRPLYRQAGGFVSGYRDAGGAADPATIELYETLTLARHVALSTQLPNRLHTTEPLLRMVEQRLAVAAR